MPAVRPSVFRTALGLLATTISWAFKLGFAATAVALPLGAMWIASSLAAHRGGSIAIAVASCVVLWPVLPVVWELLSTWRARRRPEPRAAVLTRYDRLVLRSVAVGVVTQAVLLVGFPASVFTALASRGDWMLGDHHGPIVDRVRDGLMAATGGLEWLHESTHRNTYRDLVDESATQTASEVAPSSEPIEPVAPVAQGFHPRADAWPFVVALHPAVASMPAEAEASIETVGRYLARAEPDARMRVKAVHDYVASRVAYDVPSYLSHDIPDQSASVVFTKRVAVCAGYSLLAAAIGAAAELEIVVVVGDARVPGEDPSGEGHAWNAARVGDRWVLFDATWDAGAVDGTTFSPGYSTDYLMAPPDVFGETHFPEEPRWQLSTKPRSRAEFIAAPAMAPAFHARGLTLRSPSGGRARVARQLQVQLDNPMGLQVRGDIARDGDRTNTGFCDDPLDTSALEIRCDFKTAGRYRVRLWEGDDFLGAIQVDATQ